MRLLGLETATRHGSVALLESGRLLERDFDPRGEGAVAAIARLLAEAGTRPADIDACAVSVGPGSFTGVRIGVAAAQGLCRATGAPAVPVGTLEGLAWAGRTSDWGMPGTLLLPSVDARRGEVYAALYRVPDEGDPPERAWGPEAVSCAELARRVAGLAPGGAKVAAGVLLGDGAALLAPLFPAESGWAQSTSLDRARAGAVARAGARRLARGGGVAPAALEPVYLRKSDAEIRREKRLPAP